MLEALALFPLAPGGSSLVIQVGWLTMATENDMIGRAGGIKNYRRFLQELSLDLVGAIADAENKEWHHMAVGTSEFQVYMRLNTWMTEVEERLAYYDATKGPKKGSV